MRWATKNWDFVMIFIVTLAVTVINMADANAAPPMNVGLSWQNADQYEDGTAMPVGDIVNNTLYCGVSSGTYQMQKDYNPLPTTITRATIFADLNLTYDVDYFCVMTHTAQNGKESVNSNEVNFTVLDPRVPAAPTLAVE